MSSQPIRNQLADHLLTPQNAALVIIDYQPIQVASIKSMDQDTLVNHIVVLGKIAALYNLPIVLSSVNVATGLNKPTIASLLDGVGDIPIYDRTTINAWEDTEFRAAVEATGRRKLIIAVLWTEACLTFPTLDAMQLGYEVYPVADAVGGTSVEAHQTALRRLEQAGAQLTSVAQVLCELQRDWARHDTSKAFADLLFKQLTGKPEND